MHINAHIKICIYIYKNKCIYVYTDGKLIATQIHSHLMGWTLDPGHVQQQVPAVIHSKRNRQLDKSQMATPKKSVFCCEKHICRMLFMGNVGQPLLP